eukprot:362522-Chlamydomonas_euryale.AAC.1
MCSLPACRYLQHRWQQPTGAGMHREQRKMLQHQSHSPAQQVTECIDARVHTVFVHVRSGVRASK